MDGFASRPRAGALFAEDFDLPETTPEPEVVDPMFSACELAAAREAARRDGYADGLQKAAENDTAATRRAMAAIAEQLAAERDVAVIRADQSAEAIARLLLDSLAAAFPAICAQYGDAEVRAIVRVVLPGLRQEQAITVRAHPCTAAAVAQEIARLDPDLAAHVQTVACETMPPGDVRIAWRSGSAKRDAAELWREVASVLMPAGLMMAHAAIRETIDGD
jgi:flagellar biosynthesis/type III secretory pathway protein FliH